MSNVREFGAEGDGVTDDTDAILHAIKDGRGSLCFPAGIYLVSRTIEIPLTKRGLTAITGDEGTARIIMKGAGPAFRLIGGHDGTGDPASWSESVWNRERMPTVRNIEIEGANVEADGFELTGTTQALFEGALIRRTRHGIRLVKRNRNVLISHCHIYHNTGVGVFLDGVNLHQINISGCHISYNRLGGIRIERSEVRNLQITGNDIEYNNARSHKGLASTPTAEIWIDATADGASVNEVTIASNTIQATESAGGANIRILEKPGTGRPPGLFAISGNVIGSQENNVHLTGCYGIAISGNTIYSGAKRNLLVEESRQIIIGSNMFRRHTPSFGTGVKIVNSEDVTITGCGVRDESEGGQENGASLLEMSGCTRVNVSGCQFIDGVPYGIDVDDCSDISINGCTVVDSRENPKSKGAIRFSGDGRRNRIALCTLEGKVETAPSAGVTLFENLD